MTYEKNRYELELKYPLILASASPRREELLRKLGFDFSIIPSGIEEVNHTDGDPTEHVISLSAAKAGKVAEHYRDFLILGADTIVVIDGHILGKPSNRVEAVAMLRKLSGREHEVFTGFTVCVPQEEFQCSEVVRSVVKFHNLTEPEIEWYASTEEPYDKAGAYAVQGKGAIFIERINGSYTNVMGLPIGEVVKCLVRENFLTFQKKCR
ncbi:MAG: Maf family protein [Syntrophales bacterium]|nr:Maf family protein [Syntrophales bacterium]